MIERLAAILSKPERLVVGLMSGTSMDGVDAALVRLRGAGTDTRCQLLRFLCRPYESAFRQELLDAASGGALSALELASLDFRVAASFARAALGVVEAAGLRPAEIDLIGSHGQTLAHRAPAAGLEPASLLDGRSDEPQPVTWQAGCASALSALTGIPVVADFRSADLALGGTGAPLVPYVDYLLRRSADESRLLLNVGGIANFTYLRAGCGPDDVLAWDVGPGNMVLDGLARATLGRDMDANGEVASKGSAAREWVEELLSEDFFVRPAPKAAGREQFGAVYAERLLHEGTRRGLTTADLLATAVELTARAVLVARLSGLKEQPLDALYVAGGGRRNAALLARLRELFSPARVQGFEALGLDPDAKEAVDFAVLAHESLHGHAGNLKQVTGAARPCILGSFSVAGLPPRPWR